MALYTGFAMPRVSKLSLPPLDWGNSSIGQRAARIRKERGFTQVELAGRLILSKLWSPIMKPPGCGLLLKWPAALPWRLTLRWMLHLNAVKSSAATPNCKVLRRLAKIEDLPRIANKPHCCGLLTRFLKSPS